MSADDESLAATLYAPTPPASMPVAPEGTLESVVLAGRYRIIALLGVGGMGAVYRARDLELDEVVALKMLRRELVAVPGILERFRQEVRLARKVTSPHVARTFDIGEHESDKFLTMELVDGESLADELERSGPLSVERVLAVAVAVCSGLAAAHAATVVHRDLKPENVLVGRDGSIKVTDFGIATAQADVRVTQGISGTPAYMAPEQVTGDPKIDARADVYAFGLMLYEMLSGDIPWKGESGIAIASARLLAAPPDVRVLRPDVPGPLAELVLRCMAKDRDERPKDAGVLIATLNRLARASEPPAAPVVLRPSAPPHARATHVKTVAVLPLRNRSAPDDDYLADGITDDLIDSLSMVRNLRVRARGAVMRFKGEDREPRELGRELGVDAFVVGSVRRDGDLVRVSVRLVSVDDAFQLWAKRFDGPAADLLAVSDEIAHAIARALDVEAAVKPVAPRAPAVVDLYLRARHAYFALGVAGAERSVALFEQALALAPNDPLVLAGAALARMAYITTHPDKGDGFRDAVSIAERAVSLAPELADGHIALANLRLHDRREADAVHEARLAVAAAPSSAEARFLIGRFYAESGATDRAIAELEIVQSLDPRLDLAVAEHARVHALLGEWDRADARLARVQTAEDDAPLVYWGNLCRFRMWERNADKTAGFIAAARESRAPASPNIAGLLRTLHDPRTNDYADELDRWLRLPNSKRRHAFLAQLKAEVAGYRGDSERCIDAVVASVELGLTDLLWVDRCPLLDFIRTDPRFAPTRTQVAARAGAIVAALG